jgi:hypothetical protein
MIYYKVEKFAKIVTKNQKNIVKAGNIKPSENSEI